MHTMQLRTLIIWAVLISSASAQRYTFNVGGGPGFPVSQTSDLANTSYHVVAGAGRNLHSHVKLDGEFMFHGLPVKDEVINAIDVPSAKGRLYSFTGNILVGAGSAAKSVYLIGGGGWYRRTVETQKKVYNAGEACAPALIWWNAHCVNGIFSTTQTIDSSSSNSGGFNVGGGLAFALGTSSLHFYTEVRYHHALTSGADTSVLPLTFGVRW
jgi:opacity protein-like surface antigen